MSKFSRKLFHCWHPIAYSHEVPPDAPYGSTLLNEALVVWRTSDGVPHAMQDLCIHRGTALSKGRLKDDCVVCPYHAWHYNAEGVCVKIPQKVDSTQVPSKARVSAYRTLERYGLIWVALEDPMFSLPELPELEEEAWKIVLTGPFEWKSDASRQVENFTDFGHFPWVHPGILGDPDRPVVDRCDVEVRGHVLHYSVTRPEAPNTTDFPVFANKNVVTPERQSRYELHLPYTIVLRLGWGDEKGMVYFFASQPIHENRCRGYCIISRNYNFDQADTTLQEFEKVVFDQDQQVVESQRPEQVPFDLAEELHLSFDAVAVNYRRTMQKQGFAYYHYLNEVEEETEG